MIVQPEYAWRLSSPTWNVMSSFLGCPGLKPHGRLTWSFHVGGGPYLDLSVMPRAQDYGKDPHWMPGIGFNEDRTTIWPPKIVNVG